MRLTNKLWIGIAVLVLLTPVGLLISDYFKAGPAWGEWGTGEIKKLAGAVPEGLNKLGSLWSAPFPDYAFKGWEEKGMGTLSATYIFSGLLGAGLIALAAWVIGKLLSRKG